jgi:TolB-like protein
MSILLVGVAILFYVFVRPEQGGRRPLPPPPGDAISIAVLPFLDLSPAKDQEYFSDGMTEEITTALAKVADLRVVGRTSAFQFKNNNGDLRAIGQALSATHLIEGSVRKAGNRLRITAQLIRVDDGTHIWAEDYDRELTDVFQIQEDIARAITASLRMPLGLKPGENLVNNRNLDPDSYQKFLQAKALVQARRGAAEQLADPIALLEKVLAEHADYAPAWSQLGLAYAIKSNRYQRSGSPGDLSIADIQRLAGSDLAQAEQAARRAIQIDPELADGYVALGRAIRDSNRAQAEEYYLKALALDPNNPEALNYYASALANAGRIKQSIAPAQHLRSLEPLVPIYMLKAAISVLLSGDDAGAAAIVKDTAANGFALVDIKVAQGRYAEAANNLVGNSGSLPPKLIEDAARFLRGAPARPAGTNLPDLRNLNWVYLYVGLPDRLFDYYEELSKTHSLDPSVAALWYSSLSAVRKTDRFKSFVRKVGLVDYWRAKGWPDLCRPVGADDFVCE